MPFQAIVESFVSTIEALYFVEFFEMTNRYGQLSVPHRPCLIARASSPERGLWSVEQVAPMRV
jgi:hypothetical protein